ncbi:MAG: hypothetical protein GY777_04025 [Candidatus Brocadiaceae bacterium]|nr:hypothetical protein [Candidatus Brocadiaceae bacterium]
MVSLESQLILKENQETSFIENEYPEGKDDIEEYVVNAFICLLIAT